MNISIDYISLAREIIGLQQHLQADLPYHINLVDAIGVDENANSRILAGILTQHDAKGNYQMLKAFASHFFGDTQLPELIERPAIVTEQQVRNGKRIDIYIHEAGKYAIILENKVMDAPEQPHQLANYIEGLSDFGFTTDQIFIGYLPSTNDTEPSDDSWSNHQGCNYRDQFRGRFRLISFRDAILPWLRQVAIPTDDADMLRQTIAIYIDYLEGLFGFRPNEHFIDMKTDEYLADKLGYTADPQDNLQKAMQTVAEIDKLKKEITRRGMDDAHAILKHWLDDAKTLYPNLAWEDRSNSSQFPSIGFPVASADRPRAFKVFIQIDVWHNCVYYGVYLAESGNLPFAEARDSLKPILEVIDKFTYSTGAKMLFAYVSIAEGYERFVKLVQTITAQFA